MDLQLQGKVALVTGGSRGIGKAIAEKLLAEGVRVAIAARDQSRLTDTVTQLDKKYAGQISGYICDTRDLSTIQQMVSEITSRWGDISILVNNAAEPGGPRPVLSEIDWKEHLLPQVDTKVMGYLRCAQVVAPLMKKSNWGRIINISGMQARNSGSTVGSIRNVAVAALTKNLADELGPSGITVSCIHPGLTRTEATESRIREQMEQKNKTRAEIESELSTQNSIRKLVDASDVAALATFLASPLSVAVTGEVIAAGGGVGTGIYY